MRAYTTMSTHLKHLLKSTGRTWRQISFEYESRINSNPAACVADGTAVDWYSLGIQNDIIKARATHLFMPNMEFCEWLVSCVPELDKTHAASTSQCVNEVGCIHFPTPTRRCSFGFWIPQNVSYFDGREGASCEMLVMYFSKGNAENQGTCNVRLKPNPNIGQNSLWYTKLIVGLGMYLSCFPDQIRPGIPDDLKHANYYAGTKQTIGISEKVIMRDGPTPHYRVGHFRVLQSDRYTHKRGQAVFVQGCFVKGQAETVLAPQ